MTGMTGMTGIRCMGGAIGATGRIHGASNRPGGRGRRTARSTVRRLAATALAVAAWATAVHAQGPTPDVPQRVRQSLVTYLDTFKLGAADRKILDASGGWSEEKQNLSLRLLSRLMAAPSASQVEWLEHAGTVDEAAADPDAYLDRLVRVKGRAILVAPVTLPTQQAELHDRAAFDLVRIAAGDGSFVDVITDAAPKAWARWSPIDVRAEATGLVLSRVGGPAPVAGDAAAATWPPAPAKLLLAAPRVAWFADTPLGDLGMDYGLFDTVVDGKKLMPADSDAFYAMLAAVGRGTHEGIGSAARKIDDVIPLIDPRQGWMQKHRGEAVRLSGIARRATRIAVDDPARRAEIGGDHYWELYVFLETPTIQIGDAIQDNFPVVCCTRRLPPGMPHGETMAEWVEFGAFPMKQYAYQLPSEAGKPAPRRETPLFIARDVVWRPDPSTKEAASKLGWVFNTLAAATAAILLFAIWSVARKSRPRNREPLPDHIDIE